MVFGKMITSEYFSGFEIKHSVHIFHPMIYKELTTIRLDDVIVLLIFFDLSSNFPTFLFSRLSYEFILKFKRLIESRTKLGQLSHLLDIDFVRQNKDTKYTVLQKKS